MTLTKEQEQALSELVNAAKMQASPAPLEPQTQEADLLKTWLGVSGGDLKKVVMDVLTKKDGLEKRLLDWAEANPLDANLEFLGLAAWAFYKAEKGQNPKIQTFVDAVYYITTCASVGYADVFAVTQPGRAIAALVMTIGPALTNSALQRPKGL